MVWFYPLVLGQAATPSIADGRTEPCDSTVSAEAFTCPANAKISQIDVKQSDHETLVSAPRIRGTFASGPDLRDAGPWRSPARAQRTRRWTGRRTGQARRHDADARWVDS